MKKHLFIGMLFTVSILLTSATSGLVSGEEPEGLSSYLSSIRLSQVKKQFAGMPNEQKLISHGADDEVTPMTPLSLNPASMCVLSACGGSMCAVSGCGLSGCVGSHCMASACVGSACKNKKYCTDEDDK